MKNSTRKNERKKVGGVILSHGVLYECFDQSVNSNAKEWQQITSYGFHVKSAWNVD